MNEKLIRLLLLEDSEDDALLVKLALAKCAPGEFDITWVERLTDGLAQIQAGHFDVVLSDLGLPDSAGLATLQEIANLAPALPLVVLTGARDEGLGRTAIEQGAQDFLTKGESDGASIARTLRYAIERKRLELTLRTANELLERRVVERTAELELTNKALAKESYWNRVLLRNASDGVHILDADGNVLEVSDSFCKMLGYSREDLIGANVSLWDVQWSPQELRQKIAEQIANGGRTQLETCHRRRDGSVFDVELSGQGLELEGRSVLFNSARDITKRRETERKIRRLTQFYAALSQCNEAIVRCTSEKELFQSICRIAVECAGLKMAWIGLVDPDTSKIPVAASFGDHAEEYLQGLLFTTDGSHQLGCGPTGVAARENQPVWNQDFQTNPVMRPWRERATRVGFRASAALPLHRNDGVVGVLTVYSGEVGIFDESTRELLLELTTDINFALDNFAREAAREQAQTELGMAEAQFRGMIEQTMSGIHISQDGRLVYVNPRLCEIIDCQPGELLGKEALDIFGQKPESRQMIIDARAQLAAGTRNVALSIPFTRKDGKAIVLGMNDSVAVWNGRSAIIGMWQDITERQHAGEEIRRYVKELEIAVMSTVRVATTLSEMRDPYTAGHERRVAEIAVAIGAELGFDNHRQEGLRVAGHLHDVGKITIPSEILSKPGKLSPIEFQLIQGHAQASYEVLKTVKFPWPVAQVALQHHERMDGRGYPQGLKGEAILFEARILAVADVVEAMSSHRPYREARGIEAALAEIERGRGTAYDPVVANACLRLFREKNYAIPG